MTWVPWLYSAVLVINACVTFMMAKWMRGLRVRNHALEREAFTAHAFVLAILDRTEGLIPCDACGKPIVVDEPAAVRITPGGTVFGHALCLPPMPEQW